MEKIYHKTAKAECNIYATNLDLTHGEMCAVRHRWPGDVRLPNAEASSLCASEWCAEARSGEIGSNDIQSSLFRQRSGRRK